MERFDLTDLVRGVVQSAQLLADQKGAQISFPQDEPVYVWGDEFKVEEVGDQLCVQCPESRGWGYEDRGGR